MRRLVVIIALAGCGRTPPDASASSDVIFSRVCARCHGAEGFGGPPLDAGITARNFHDQQFQARRTDAQLRTAIIDGRNGAMPAFGHSFTNEALDGLVARIRSFNPREANP